MNPTGVSVMSILMLVIATMMLVIINLHTTMAVTVLTAGGATFPQLAYADAISAYKFSDSSVTINYVPSGSGAGKTAVTSNVADFSGTDSVFSDVEYATPANYDIQLYPTIAGAACAIYNIAGVSSTDPTLVFSRSTMAAIFAGNITWWRDSRIVADNKLLASKLPDANITLVVRAESSGTSKIVSSALCAFSSDWCRVYGPAADLPKWPTTASKKTGGSGVASAVVSIANSIGYGVLDEATSRGLSCASLINRAGNVVRPSIDTIAAAVTEFGTTGITSRLSLSLIDGAASLSWPMTSYTYLALRKNTTAIGSTCAQRTALVTFWRFFYTSDVIASLVNRRGFAPLSGTIRDLVLTSLTNGVLCTNGLPALSGGSVSSQVIGEGSSLTDPMYTLYMLTYALKDCTTSGLTYTQRAVTSAVQRLQAGTISFTSYLSTSIETQGLQPLLASSQVSVAAAFGAIVPIYLLTASPATQPVVTFTAEIITQIYMGNLTMWNDVRLQAINVNVTLPAKPIIVVVSVAATEATLLLTERLASMYAPFGDYFPVNNTMTSYNPNTIFVNTDAAVLSAVTTYDNSFGMFLPSATMDTIRVGNVVNPSGRAIAPGTTSYQACATAHTLTQVAASNGNTTNGFTFDLITGIHQMPSGCYPFTVVVNIAMPVSYTGTAQCAAGKSVLQFLSWMYQGGDFNTPLAGMRLAPLPDTYRQMILDTLNDVTCGVVSILNPPLDVVTLGLGLRGVVYAMNAIGLAGAVASLIIIIWFRAERVLRTASVPFLLTMVVGFIPQYVASILLMMDTPTDRECTTLIWTFGMGFSVVFGAIFAKTWRIHKIFSSTKVRLLFMPTSKLFVYLSIFVAVECAYLAIWQGVAPLRSRTLYQGAMLVTSCGPAAGSHTNAFIYGMMAFKGFTILFGLQLTIGIRNVKEEFNESKYIGLSMYALFFTALIIIPLVTLISGDHRATTFLMSFGLFWITTCTMVFILGPKFITILRPGPAPKPSSGIRSPGGRRAGTVRSSNGSHHSKNSGNHSSGKESKRRSGGSRAARSGASGNGTGAANGSAIAGAGAGSHSHNSNDSSGGSHHTGDGATAATSSNKKSSGASSPTGAQKSPRTGGTAATTTTGGGQFVEMQSARPKPRLAKSASSSVLANGTGHIATEHQVPNSPTHSSRGQGADIDDGKQSSPAVTDVAVNVTPLTPLQTDASVDSKRQSTIATAATASDANTPATAAVPGAGGAGAGGDNTDNGGDDHGSDSDHDGGSDDDREHDGDGDDIIIGGDDDEATIEFTRAS